MRAIDADALTEELNNSHFPGAPYVDAGISIAIGKVLDAPTIEPQRKKGEWVPAKDGYEGHVKCSRCFKTYDWTSQAQYYDFCPNCGVEMDREDGDAT